jgi:hypothetical protein
MSFELRSDIFREVNERIAEITGMWQWEDKQGFLCECATAHCTQAVWLTRAQYASVRAARSRFVAAPGHELPGGGRVVERYEEFVVIEKLDSGTLATLENAHRQA